jgi:hypothetical protein
MHRRLVYSINSSARSKERFGNFQSKRLGGRKVDDEIELGRLLNREVAQLRSA